MDETNWIKISFDRIECSSLSRSAYCASPLCVYVCVCVFSPPLDKVGEYIAADTTTSIQHANAKLRDSFPVTPSSSLSSS